MQQPDFERLMASTVDKLVFHLFGATPLPSVVDTDQVPWRWRVTWPGTCTRSFRTDYECKQYLINCYRAITGR